MDNKCICPLPSGLLQCISFGLFLSCIWVVHSPTAKAQEVDSVATNSPIDSLAYANPRTQIITAEEIAQAGLSRLSDLFVLIDDWMGTSVEGYSWQSSANGLASYQEAAWTLLIDGQPVNLFILNAQNINTAPISIHEISYVEAINTPTFVAGNLYQGGVLHIHTHNPDEGASIKASITAGNEVGDPGPYRYTPYSTPNIDRIGPTLQGAASYAASGWHIRVQGKVDEHHATDERIRERVQTLYQGEKAPRLLLSSTSVDIGTTGQAGNHRVTAGFSRFQDLYFFEPIGLENPMDHRFYQIGARGDFSPGKPSGISYRLSYTSSSLDPRESKGGLNLDWRQNQFRGQYEVRFGTSSLRGALGLNTDYLQSFSEYTLADARLPLNRAYGDFFFRYQNVWEQRVMAYITQVKGVHGFGVLATLTARPTPAHTLSFVGSVVRQPYAETNRLWYWIRQGYDFLGDQGIDVSLPAVFNTSTTFLGDLSWRYRPSDQFSLTLAGSVRRFNDLTLAAYSFRYDSLTTGFNTETAVRSPVFGRLTKGSAAIQFRLSPSLDQRVYYAYQRFPSADGTYWQAWQNQPWHRFSYTLRFTPLERLSLYARVTYTSKTEWPDYFEAADVSQGRYEAQLPGVWLLDLSARKRLWRDHLQLNLAFRNLLNKSIRTHPAGAATNMVFQVQLQFYFNSQRP